MQLLFQKEENLQERLVCTLEIHTGNSYLVHAKRISNQVLYFVKENYLYFLSTLVFILLAFILYRYDFFNFVQINELLYALSFLRLRNNRVFVVVNICGAQRRGTARVVWWPTVVIKKNFGRTAYPCTVWRLLFFKNTFFSTPLAKLCHSLTSTYIFQHLPFRNKQTMPFMIRIYVLLKICKYTRSKKPSYNALKIIIPSEMSRCTHIYNTNTLKSFFLFSMCVFITSFKL